MDSCAKIWLFCLWTIFGIVACGDVHTTKVQRQPQFERPTPPLVFCNDNNLCTKAKTACAFTPDEGPRDIPPIASSAQIVTEYFEKPIALKHLQALMAVSGEATWNYILNLRVPISKAPLPLDGSKCQYFAALPPAGAEEVERWNRFLDDSGGKGLLGLFSTKVWRDDNTGEAQLYQPAIMVREDAERWTLLHEFQHYLFAEARLQEPQFLFDEELFEQMAAAERKIPNLLKNLKMDPIPGHALALESAYREFFQKSYQLDRRGPLEEFAIESFLLESWWSEQLQWIHPRRDLNNAVAYMSSNKRQVEDNYILLKNKLSTLENLCRQKGWTQALKRTQQLLWQVEEVLHFMTEKMEKAYFVLYTSPGIRKLPAENDDEEDQLPHYERGPHDKKDNLYRNLK